MQEMRDIQITDDELQVIVPSMLITDDGKILVYKLIEDEMQTVGIPMQQMHEHL